MSCIIPPTILRQPESQIVNLGDTLTLFVIVYSSSPITSYQWYDGSGNPIVGATSATYIIPNVTFENTGSYYVVASNILGSVTSTAAVINVVDEPDFLGYTTVPPTLNSTAIPNGSAFSITANVAGGSIEYQWQKGGINIFGATSETYSDASATLIDSGVYRVTYKNPANPVFEPASSTVTVSVIDLPRIVTQPAPKIVAVGSSATFSVSVSGTPPITYQWYRNNLAIPTAITNSYTIPLTVPGDNGAEFYVDISNAYGSVDSSEVSLTVVNAPVINSQPTGGSIIDGGSFTMCVSASGYDNRYQWYKTRTCGVSGEAIAGATGPCYSISPARGSDAGVYYVVVTNIAGDVPSVCIALYVEVIDCVRGLIGFAGGAKEGANMASGLTSQKERVVLRCHNAEVLPRARNEVLPQCIGGFVPSLYVGGSSSGALLQSKINAQIVCDVSMNLALAKRRMSVQPCAQPVGDTRFLKYQRLGPPVPCAPPPTGFIIPYNPAVPTAIDGPCVNVIGIRVTRP